VKGVTLETDGVCAFPDAPTERGVKHLNGLARAAEEGYGTYVLFVVQMEDVRYLHPNDKTDPAFGRALRQAAEAGVEVLAVDCRVTEDEMRWICKYHGIHTERVVTVGYYSLVKLDKGMVDHTMRNGAVWKTVDQINHLIMDHMDILSDALTFLQKDVLLSPSAFQLLPKKFTIRKLQNLLEAILGIDIDNRNFRKKLFSSGILIETDEFEKHVSHKPARLYKLSKGAFSRKDLGKGFQFVAAWLL
jgi:hypothetical protein